MGHGHLARSCRILDFIGGGGNSCIAHYCCRIRCCSATTVIVAITRFVWGSPPYPTVDGSVPAADPASCKRLRCLKPPLSAQYPAVTRWQASTYRPSSQCKFQYPSALLETKHQVLLMVMFDMRHCKSCKFTNCGFVCFRLQGRPIPTSTQPT